MTTKNELLRRVARGVRYRRLEGPLKQEVQIGALQDLFQLPGQILPDLGCAARFDVDRMKNAEALIRKYGFLDLRYDIDPSCLRDVEPVGISGLKELGFLPTPGEEYSQEVAEIHEEAACLQHLSDEVDREEGVLLLFLDPLEDPVEGLGLRERFLRMTPEFQLPLPLTFRVRDAAISNSSFVWINRYFYL